MSKITAYNSFTTVAENDLLVGVDVSDTTMAATGTDKKITYSQLNAVDWINVVTQYGADPTGVADSTTAIQNAVTAAINAGGGTVYLPAGTYKTSSTITANMTGTAVYIRGEGTWATTINYYGSGDCFRIYTTSQSDGGVNGGSIEGLVIDGTNSSASAASAGLHMGDVFQYHVDIGVRNFANFAGSIGAHFDNQYFFTEQLHGRVYAYNCTAHIVFDHGTGADTYGSFFRLDMQFYISQANVVNDGVVLQNGAYWYDGAVAIRGNFVTSASAQTSAVLKITGTSPGGSGDAGAYSLINSCRLDIGVEADGGLAHSPYSIYFGTPVSGNSIRNCYGVIDYGSWSTLSNNNNSITYQGPISGDANITAGFVASYAALNVLYLGDAALTAGGNGLFQQAYDGNYYACGQYLVQTTSGTTGSSGTSSQSITGLITPTLGAGQTYYVEITVPWEPQATVGSHTNWGLLAGSSLTLTSIGMASLIMTSGTTAEAGTSAYVTSTSLSDAMWTGPTVATTAGWGLARFWGTVTVNHAGTLQMVFVNASTGDLVNMGAGATMLIRPLS